MEGVGKVGFMKYFKEPFCLLFVAVGLAMLVGCATTDTAVEKGPQNTRAYSVEVTASESGVRIEADGDYVGFAPCTFKVFGDKDGTFHNFGTDEYVVKAYPTNTSMAVQTKVFQTGRWFSQEDRIPSRIYFDMADRSDEAKQSEGFSIDLPQQYENNSDQTQ